MIATIKRNAHSTFGKTDCDVCIALMIHYFCTVWNLICTKSGKKILHNFCIKTVIETRITWFVAFCLLVRTIRDLYCSGLRSQSRAIRDLAHVCVRFINWIARLVSVQVRTFTVMTDDTQNRDVVEHCRTKSVNKLNCFVVLFAFPPVGFQPTHVTLNSIPV